MQDEAKTTTKAIDFKDDIEYHRTADFLGIDNEDRNDFKLANKISTVYDWGSKKSGSEDRIDALMEIKNLQRRIGLQGQGTDVLKKLYKWIRLDSDRKRIEKKMELIYE